MVTTQTIQKVAFSALAWATLALPSAFAATSSVSGTGLPAESQILDAALNSWTLSSGVVYENSKLAGRTSGVAQVLYKDGVIYQENASNLWWAWNGSAWAAVSDPRVVSASGAAYSSGDSLVDAAKNIWALSGGAIYENGKAAGYSAGVAELYYKNGLIYQESAAGLWWSWNGSAWKSATNPISASPSPSPKPSASATPKPSPSATPSPTGTPVDSALPTDVKNVGYTNRVFFDDFDNLDSIDVNNSESATVSYNWYTRNYSSGSVTPAKYITQHNVDGVTAIRLDPANASIYGALKIGGVAKGPQFAMRKNGGAYFEARMAYGETGKSTNAWPSFWANPTDHMLNIKMPWSGNAANKEEHYVENDIMEYFHDNKSNKYNATLHDWYGQYTVTCPGTPYCQAPQDTQALGSGAPLSIASTETNPVFHRFGALWVPSIKQANGTYTQGSMRWYLDGKQVGVAVTWTGDIPATPSDPGTAPWRFAAIDNQAMSLVLNSGSEAFVYVDYVGVWQLP